MMLERDDAMLKPSDLILDPGTPLNTARAFLELKYSIEEIRTLYHQNGAFYRYKGTHYTEFENDGLRSELWHFLDSADCESNTGPIVPFRPTVRRVTDVIDALKAAAYLPLSSDPSWLEDGPNPPPDEVISCQNGLLHLPKRKLIAHTPTFFTHTALPFAYDPNAPAPTALLPQFHLARRSGCD
jgi:putative DNA primase/helicase